MSTSPLERILAPKIIACIAGIWQPGNKYCLPVQTAAEVIRASGSRALVVHIPGINEDCSNKTFSLEELIEELSIPLSEIVFLFNTSLCSTLDDVQKVIKIMNSTRMSFPYEEIPALLKLEIFDARLRPDDQKTIRILEEFEPKLRNICIPFLVGEENSLQRISSLGCPAARIWCSDIGKGLGITDELRLERLLNLTSIPLILEGGLATSQDVQKALAMGFSAVLMNSAFRYSPNPVDLASEIRTAIDVFEM